MARCWPRHARPRAGTNRLGSTMDEDIDTRVPLQHVLQHDPRPSNCVVAVEECIDEEERVARSGVATEHEHWTVRRRRLVGKADVDGDPERSTSGTHHAPQPPRHELVVRLLEGRGPQFPAESRHDPDREQHDETEGFEHEVDEEEPCDAEDPPPARDEA